MTIAIIFSGVRGDILFREKTVQSCIISIVGVNFAKVYDYTEIYLNNWKIQSSFNAKFLLNYFTLTVVFLLYDNCKRIIYLQYRQHIVVICFKIIFSLE